MKTSRQHNYNAPTKPSTVSIQEEIRHWLQLFQDGFTMVELANALGISRQLALYHTKVMVAQQQGVVAVLGPCEANDGVQFRVWDEEALCAYYARHNITPPLRHLRAA